MRAADSAKLEKPPRRIGHTRVGVRDHLFDLRSAMHRILFICSQNRLRSPTAEHVFSEWPGIEVMSAGLDPSASVPVTPELLQWAQTIFVMEKSHRNKLSRKFRQYLKSQRVICLNIPDEYDYMDERLVRLLTTTVPKYLPGRRPGPVHGGSVPRTQPTRAAMT